jgi:hypothetical protein
MSNPADLNITPQPDTDKNFFNFKAVGLKVNETYAIKFQWIYEDLTLSGWSPGYFITTSNETAPAVPSSATVPSTSTGGIPVTLSVFPANAQRVDVIVTGGVFGTSKVAHSFTTSGVANIAATPGFYTVQLRSISPTGVTSTVGESFTITVASVGEAIQAPTNPNGFTSKRILAGIEVAWDGTYTSSTFTGFEAINIYAGNSATATSGTYEQVGVLTGNNVKNTIVIPLGTYVVYGQAVYIHAAAVNRSGTVGTIQANVTNQALGPGKATDADINDGAVVISKLASDVLTVGNLKAGDINATSYIRAGTKSTDGLSGARVEISSSTITQTGTNVLPGLTVYASDGTQLLRAPLTGGLTITGGGTFTGALSGASGQFDGDLGASGGNFRVRSGDVTALSGQIGNWIINSGVLKSGSEAFPRILLDPTNSQIVLRASQGSSDSGNLIKLDPSVGIKVGTTALPKFTVDMSGNMSATDGTFSSGTFNGNITSSATITGGTVTGSRISTAVDSYYGSVRMGYTEGFGSGSTLEVVGADNTVYGQLYQYNNGTELILRHGSTRGAEGYPRGSALLSLNPYTITLGYADPVSGLTNSAIDISADGSHTIQNTLTGLGNGNIALSQFRNISAGSAVKSTSDSSGYIGDIYIQY